MSFIRGLLLDPINATQEEAVSSIAKDAYESFKSIINIVLPVALGVVLLIGTIYAIVLGVNYAKAEESEKRKKAREHLIGAIVGFGITLVIIAVIYGVLNLSLFEKLIRK